MHATLRPTFVTLTWRSAFKDESLWIRIGKTIQNEFEIECLMHLTCHLPVSDLKRVLKNCREAGLRNILALRGDPPIGQERWKKREGCLNNAMELVRLIRQEHGDYFCIAVAGYPESHIETWNSPHLPPSEQCRKLDVSRLKGKMDAGADFIVTQFFFDVKMYLAYRERCRALGINVPILPGYLPIQNYKSYKKFTKWCKTHVPSNVVSDLEKIKDNDQAVKAYGIRLAVETMKHLIRNDVKTLHFYTMNLSLAVRKILTELKLVSAERVMPWSTGRRQGEEVRPIFWARRPLSYISRTRSWGEFPNGRWGDSESPAYGELTDYYLAFKRKQKTDDRLKQWGTPQNFDDVAEVFRKFVKGKVTILPWSDEAMSKESTQITDQLEWVNANGFLTINSQPRVNAAPSDDANVGWGGPGGYVFQKSYLEFFTSPDLFKRLLKLFPDYPSLSYHAINRNGDEFTNCVGDSTVTAVTWGVFPGREIIQPTVVDHDSFRAWKDEAFELWLTQWANVYEKKRDEDEKHKRSGDVIRKINSSYYLVNIVDNDYTNSDSDIFAIFKRLVVDDMNTKQLKAYVRKIDSELMKVKKKHVAAETSRSELARRLKRSEEECATLISENRKLKAQIEYRQAMRARSYS